MKIKDEIKNYNKPFVHRNYSRIIEDYKNYDKISKNKMLDQVLKVYNETNNILSICTFNEIKLLKKALKKKLNKEDINTYERDSLTEKFLLCNNEIPEELIQNIKQAVKLSNKDQMLEKDFINNVLIGIMKIYGILTLKDVLDICKYYIDIEDNELLNHLETNLNFNFYVYKIFFRNSIAFIYEPYFYIENELVEKISNNKLKKGYLRPIEDILFLRYNKFDIRNEVIKEFVNNISKLPFFHFQFLDEIELIVALNENRDKLINNLKNVESLKYIDLTKTIDLMNKAMDEMPSAVLNGYTLNEYKVVKEEENFNKNYKKMINNLQDNKTINDYKHYREITEKIFENCSSFIINKQKDLEQFKKVMEKNNIEFIINEPSEFNNLITFHKINNEETLFKEYFNEEINILSRDYNYVYQMDESYTESLFKIKDIDTKNASIKLMDLYTNDEHEIIDIAMSNSKNTIKNSYIYMSIITINNISFSTGYGFILLKHNHEDIIKELDEKVKQIKYVNDLKTKRFIACYKMFKQENIMFTHKVIE